MKKSQYHQTAKEIADLVVKKQQAYGDSFGQSAKIIKILYPQGIKINQFDDALALLRILDKLFRIATDRDALGENPWKDILGYALLAVTKQKNTLSIQNALEILNLGMTAPALTDGKPYFNLAHTRHTNSMPSKAPGRPKGTRSKVKRTLTSSQQKKGLKP